MKIGMGILLAFLLSPNPASADCANLERYTAWVLDTSNSLIFYAGKTPLARVELQECEISPLSRIRLLSSYVCESDKIEIDGGACQIITVTVLD